MPNQPMISIFESMCLIREAEKLIVAEYHKDEMKSPMHMSWGEEAAVLGVVQAAGPLADFFGTYRSHALYLARTRKTFEFFGEMLGKSSGAVGGRGGSMHLADFESGVFSTSAIVGGNISVAVGKAFSNRILGNNRVAVALFGDGAMDAGTFWESINIAVAMKCPVVFVCLDNGWAVHTPEEARRGFRSHRLKNLASTVGAQFFETSSKNVFDIMVELEDRFKEVVNNNVPLVVRLEWFRFLEHVGISSDFEDGYRTEPSPEELKTLDPVLVAKDALLATGVTSDELNLVENRARIAVEDALARARNESEAPSVSASERIYID